MNKRHILVVNIHFAPFSYGGATLVAEEVAKELAARGYRISCVSAMTRRDLPPYSVIRTTPFPGIDNYLVVLPPHRSAAEIDQNPKVTAALHPLVDQLRPDVAHLHCLQELGAGTLDLFTSRGIPSVLSFHDFWWACARQFMIKPDGTYCGQDPIRASVCANCVGPGAKPRLEALSAIARGADLRTAPSRFAAGLLERSGLGPVEVWENGITPIAPNFFERRRAREGVIKFAYVGGPSDMKGWPVLGEALRRFSRSDCVTLLVEGGVFETWWNEDTLSNIPSNVRVVPRFSPESRDDFFADIDVLLFPSRWNETFGLVVREALARGLRVIRPVGGGQAEHAATEAVREIPLDATASDILMAMNAAAEQIASGGARTLRPIKVASVADQADAFVVLLERL